MPPSTLFLVFFRLGPSLMAIFRSSNGAKNQKVGPESQERLSREAYRARFASAYCEVQYYPPSDLRPPVHERPFFFVRCRLLAYVFPVQRLNAWAKELTSQYPNKQFRGLAMSQMVYCCCAATEILVCCSHLIFIRALTGCNESSRNRCPNHDQ